MCVNPQCHDSDDSTCQSCLPQIDANHRANLHPALVFNYYMGFTMTLTRPIGELRTITEAELYNYVYNS
jgi:hypothetical protein